MISRSRFRPVGGGFDAVRRAAACRTARWDTDQIVRRFIERQQDPCRPRARRLVTGGHLARNHLGDGVDVPASLGRQRYRRRHPPWCIDGGRQCRAQRIEAASRARDGWHDRRAEPRRQPRDVDLDALFLRLVDHVQRDDDAGAGLEHLVDEVKVAREGGSVNDDEDGVRPQCRRGRAPRPRRPARRAIAH